MTYKVVTISNREPQEYYYTYKYLQKSVGSHEILILGQQAGEYTGLSDKPRILHKAISDGLIKEDIILFVDAWDVVFVDKPEVIIDKYKAINIDVEIGAEKNCFPSCFKKEYDRWAEPFNTSYKYLNSGVIVGRTDAIMTILEAMDAPNLPVDYRDGRTGRNFHFNDQAYYMDIALRQPVGVKLDRSCWIVQNMQDVAEDEISLCDYGSIVNNETKEKPSIIHWNGGSKDKWSREPILKHLNLL